MAEITKGSAPSLSSPLPPPNNQIAGLTAGEALGAWDNVYVKSSDNKVYKATGAAVADAAQVLGQVPQAHASGDKDVTIYFGNVTANYGSGLTPGKTLFLSGSTAGGLADAASTGGLLPIAYTIDTTRVRFLGTVLNAATS